MSSIRDRLGLGGNTKTSKIRKNLGIADIDFSDKEIELTESDYAPVKSDSSSKEDKKWYQKIFTKGEFEDGVDGIGDFAKKTAKTILGTATDITQDVGKGMLKIVEAPIDIATNLVATGFNAFGKEDTAKKIRNFADRDLSENFSNVAANVNPVGITYNLLNGTPENIINPAGIEYDKDKSFLENYKTGMNKAFNSDVDTNEYEKSSSMGYYADKTTELVGYALGLIYGGQGLTKATGTAKTGITNSAGKTMLGASASGGNIGLTLAGRTLNIPTLAVAGGMASGLQEANSKEGVTEAERWTKGLSSGIIEGATEGLFSMLGVGGITNEAGQEIFDVVGTKAANLFKTSLGKTLANAGIKATGETIEEAISYTLNYLSDNHIIDKMGEADFSKEWNWAELGETLALSFASSMIMQGGGGVIQTNSAIAESEKQLGRKLTSEEKALVTQASIEGTLEEKVRGLEGSTQETQTQANDPIQQPINVEQEVQNIDNQIMALEEQLSKTTNDTEYERISNEIRVLEERANQLEQQETAPVKQASVPNTQLNEQSVPTQQENALNAQLNEQNVQLNNEIAPVQAQNVQETEQQNVLDSKQINNVDNTPKTEPKRKTMTQKKMENIEGSKKTNQDGYEYTIPKSLFQGKSTAPIKGDSVTLAKYGEGEYYTPRKARAEGYGEVTEYNDLVDKFQNPYIQGTPYNSKMIELLEEFKKNNPDRASHVDKALKQGFPLTQEYMTPKEMKDLYLKAGYDSFIGGTDSAPEYLSFTNDNTTKNVQISENTEQRATPSQEELDNLEDTRLNKSGSEYAAAFYELENKYGKAKLYKGLNNYNSTGKALEEIAPLKQELSDLTSELKKTIKDTKKEIKSLKNEIKEVKTNINEAVEGFEALTKEDLPNIEQQSSETLKNITDEDIAPVIENTTPEYEPTTIESPLEAEGRDIDSVGNRKVKAYQYENPEVRPYFQAEAKIMLDDLHNSIKGEKVWTEEFNPATGLFENAYVTGTKRQTTSDIAYLLDNYNYTYADIEKGLKAIIEDDGKENIAVAKRIEFMLDERLREGYTSIDGTEIPANQEYINLLQGMEQAKQYSEAPLGEAPTEITEEIPYTDSASKTETAEEIAPVRNRTNINEVEDTSRGKQQQINLNNLGETLQDNNVDWDSVESTSLENAKQLTIDGTEEDLVTKTKKELRKALLGTEAQKEFIMSALDNAKNRSMALMNNTDTIRNTELVFGREAGRVINDVIFQKEIDNEADSIKWQNDERKDIKELGIKARSKESAAVQKYGEKQWVNDAGEVLAYGDAELASEFSDVETQEKIKNAAKAIRSKYDNYIDRANEVLTKLGFEPIKKRNDYMRHFQELNDVFSRHGIPFNAQNMQEHVLPTDINGLTEFWSPQKNYFANMQARKGMKTTYDAITGIDGYIGGIANLIYHTEDIQRGRAFEELIRETYGEDKGWDNLENLPDELKQLRAEKIQNNHASNYAAWVHEWTNNVAGKKNKIDRSVEAVFGRRAFSFLDETRKQVGSNMIGFNLSSSLTNLIAPVQAMAKTNKLAVAKGTADTIKNMFVKDSFMDNNKFLTSRMGTDMISKNAWQKIQDAGFIFMKGMDWFSSNQIVRSKYYELRAKGMSEQQAHAEAGQFAARILGDRTKGANAQIYNSKLLGLVTQFQLEVNNQLYSTFYDTYQESKENAQGNALKTAAGMTFTLGQLFAFTHLFGQTFEAIAGYNPTFDVIEILKTAFGWGEDDDDEEKTTSERLKAAADKLVDSLPYVNILTGGGRIPVASGIPNLVGVATGGKDEYGNELTLEDELKKLLYLIPPTGGNQVKKTYQGLSMFDEDLPVKGSYTDSGNLRFPVEDTPLNKLQAALFGQWSNKNAREYFDNERQPLKSKQIQEYADLDLPIKDYWEYRDGLKEQSTIQEKFDYINSLDVSDEQKNIMINNAVERKEQIDISNYNDFSSYDEFDYAIKNPDKYRVIEQIDTYDKYISYKEDISSIKEQFSSDNGYSTEQRKAAVQQYIESLPLDIPQKIMLEKMVGGYSIKSYKSYMQSYIESLPLTAEEKQAIDDELFK